MKEQREQLAALQYHLNGWSAETFQALRSAQQSVDRQVEAEVNLAASLRRDLAADWERHEMTFLQESPNFELGDASAAGGAASHRFESLITEYADRDRIAMQGALLRSQELVRGQPTNPCEYRV